MLVKTIYGEIEGTKEGAAYVFKGIPYAKPPVGALRFCAPKKPDPFNGVLRADHYPACSMQNTWDSPDGFYEKEFQLIKETGMRMSEDSLYLNIWVPADMEPGQKLPVLFYIHGGAFLGGAGHEMEFRTDAYAKRGIILVTVNYRVGILGLLAHPWLAQEDPAAVGNYAILDQIAALDWVQENIAAFGGDPGQVTICGQSAGGMSVETLLATRYADKKYARAIIQSSGGYPQYIMKKNTLDEAFALGKRLMELAGVNSVEALRSAAPEKLLEAQNEVVMEALGSGKTLPFAPVINGVFLEEFITEAVEHGNLNVVPTMIGCTKDDIETTPEEAAAGEGRMSRSDIAWSLMNEAVSDNPSYVYYFRRNLPGDDAGAFHSGELWYMFGSLDKCWRPMTEADYTLSEEMLDYWSNFIRTGNPEGEHTGEWKKCERRNPYVKVLDM